MKNRAKFIFVCIFFGGLGLVCLYFAIDIFITGKGIRGQEILLVNYENPFIKYAVAYLFIAFSIPCFAFPILAFKGILTLDYNKSTKYIKAKNDFILCSLSIPFVSIIALIFFAEGCSSGLNCKMAVLGALLFGGYYSWSIFILIKKQTHERRFRE